MTCRKLSDRLQDLGGQSLERVARDYLARMQTAAARMQGLINDLLTLSHISTRGLQLAPTNLAKIIHDEVLVDLEASLDESHGTVEVGDMPHLIADPLQMRQLMQNLIGNGLKFRRAGVPPRIRISSEPLKDATTGALRYRIIVEDNGIGSSRSNDCTGTSNMTVRGWDLPSAAKSRSATAGRLPPRAGSDKGQPSS
jgi:signal transduction histidine kinase